MLFLSTSDSKRSRVSKPFPKADMDEARDVSNGCGLVCSGIAVAHPLYEAPPPEMPR